MEVVKLKRRPSPLISSGIQLKLNLLINQYFFFFCSRQPALMDSNTLKVKMGEAGKCFTLLARHVLIMLKDGCYTFMKWPVLWSARAEYVFVVRRHL